MDFPRDSASMMIIYKNRVAEYFSRTDAFYQENNIDFLHNHDYVSNVVQYNDVFQPLQTFFHEMTRLFVISRSFENHWESIRLQND